MPLWLDTVHMPQQTDSLHICDNVSPKCLMIDRGMGVIWAQHYILHLARHAKVTVMSIQAWMRLQM